MLSSLMYTASVHKPKSVLMNVCGFEMFPDSLHDFVPHQFRLIRIGDTLQWVAEKDGKHYLHKAINSLISFILCRALDRMSLKHVSALVSLLPLANLISFRVTRVFPWIYGSAVVNC